MFKIYTERINTKLFTIIFSYQDPDFYGIFCGIFDIPSMKATVLHATSYCATLFSYSFSK